MHLKLLALGAASLLLFAACDNAEPTPNPEVAFCDSLQTLTAAVVDMEKLGPTDTVDEVQSGAIAVQDAFQSFKSAAGELAESEVAAIESAAADLKFAAESVDTNDTVVAALDSLTPQIRALKKAGVQAGTAQCGLVEAQEAASAAAEAVELVAADAQTAVESAAADAQAAIESAAP